MSGDDTDMTNTAAADRVDALVIFGATRHQWPGRWRQQTVEDAWRVVDPILKHWIEHDNSTYPYSAGSWGPQEADRLLASGQAWRDHI